jgi:hypothetical protein
MKLTNEDKSYLLSLKISDINNKLLIDLFANKVTKVDGKPVTKKSRFNTYDEFVLDTKDYFNTEKVTTNVGLFIYNKLLIEEDLQKIVGYVNKPVNGSVQKEIDSKISKALLEDKISPEVMVKYCDRMQWLGMQFNSIICSSFTEKTVGTNKNIIKHRDKLLKDNKEAIKNNDLNTVVKIEKELVDYARAELKGDPGIELYDSGARGNFDGNYKESRIMKGPIYNPINDEWDVVQTNFVEGMDKRDIPSYGNSIVAGSYPKAVGTQTSGYLTKQLTATFQGVVLDLPHSDCGTKGYIELYLTPWIVKDVMYSFVIDGNKLVELNGDNINKYVGKVVKLRNPCMCIGEKICNKCAGNMMYKLGITNIGLTTSRISFTMLNLNMKKIHSAVVKMTKIDLNRITL